MSLPPDHATLVGRLFEIEAIRFGEFTLKSGITDPTLVRQSRDFLKAARFA